MNVTYTLKHYIIFGLLLITCMACGIDSALLETPDATITNNSMPENNFIVTQSPAPGSWRYTPTPYVREYAIYGHGPNYGYNSGYNVGVNYGYNTGYNAGQNYGYNSGQNFGINHGYNQGYNSGYNYGHNSGYNIGPWGNPFY